MALTFRKAGSAMVVTTLTTAASFLATCISPIMPIISFGIYAAIVVCINFLMIISTMPLVIFVYELDIKPNFQCCGVLIKCIRNRLLPKNADVVSDIGQASLLEGGSNEIVVSFSYQGRSQGLLNCKPLEKA